LDSTTDYLVVPVQIRDSITARLMFDTGMGQYSGHDKHIILDSVFTYMNNLLPDSAPAVLTMDFPLADRYNIKSPRYQTDLSIKMGQTMITYDELIILPSIGQGIDGVFTIPVQDTNHIWEINFENNYLAIHAYDSFQWPQSCMVFPLLNCYQMTIPMSILCSNDTLHSNYVYTIDTGNSLWDMILPPSTAEAVFFEKYWENKWRTYDGGVTIYKENRVKANMWNNFTIDTLKIYTLDWLNQDKKNIGLKFLKRFNLYFDMHKRQIGLLPIPYKQTQDSSLKTFYYSVDINPTPQGNYKINFIPDFNANYFKTAGLKVGDDIVSYNGYAYKDILQRTVNIDKIISNTDTLTYDILRDGQLMTIFVPISENDKKKYIDTKSLDF
jgi:hypothetical protein